jgi:hypothetical protein
MAKLYYAPHAIITHVLFDTGHNLWALSYTGGSGTKIVIEAKEAYRYITTNELRAHLTIFNKDSIQTTYVQQ